MLLVYVQTEATQTRADVADDEAADAGADDACVLMPPASSLSPVIVDHLHSDPAGTSQPQLARLLDTLCNFQCSFFLKA